MNIKETLKSFGRKLKAADFKKILNTKAFLIVGCVALVGVAVLIGSLVSPIDDAQVAGSESARILGNSLLVDNQVSGIDAQAEQQVNETSGDLLSVAVYNRQQVREEAMDVLQSIAENPETLPDAKEEALAEIAAIVSEMSAEANIETLTAAKGIEKCVAVISGDKCSVIVDKEGLLKEELARITEIVYEQSGILPANIRIIENASD